MGIFYVDTGSFDNLLVTGSLLISGSIKIPISATNPPSETGSFYFNTVSKSLFTYDGTQWYSGSSGGGAATTVTNFGDNRIITSDGTSTGLNAESNFIFDSSTLRLTGNQEITGSLTITQNLTVLGSSSIQYISSSVLNVEDNIITVNTSNPSVRFGGLSIIDSGSSPQRSGSILFDSQNNQFIFLHQSSGTPTSSVFIQGPQTFGNIGNETTLTTNRITKAVGGDLGEHIGNSNISDSGTLVSINSNTSVIGILSVTGSTVISSSTSTPAITLIGSGSTILSISGSNGSVFSINDSTSGSLFAVTDGNGQPIFDVQSSGRVFVGSTSNGYSYEELTRQTLILNGTSSIYTIPTSSYGSFIMDYTITSGSAPTPGVRTGTLYSTWFGGFITVSDAGVATIGDSTGFVFNAITSSGNVIIQTQVANQPWRLSAYIRVLPV